ncbi:N-acetyltransferase family protein, partial [Rhizobiaceae sp. 2RAB30]
MPATGDFVLRDCARAEIEAITAIYGRAVLNGRGSFELDPPSETEMTARWAALAGAGFPYLVAVGNCRLAGSAYAGACRPRPA